MTSNWFAAHRGKTVVVKFGGNAMVNDVLASAFAADIVALHSAGLRVVVCHGGGPQISSELTLRGIANEFRGGLRFTSADAVLAVREVLVSLGSGLAAGLNAAGGKAIAFAGDEGSLFSATRRGTLVEGLPVDLGQVGDVTSVNPKPLEDALADGFIPVVSAIAPESGSPDGYPTLLNVNADSAAASLAVALQADWLILLTDVAGLYRDWPKRDSLIESITLEELDALLPHLESGMIPKMTACRFAVANGVGAAAIIDGRVPHALLSAPFGSGGTTVQKLKSVAV